jgi:hypothetical protein
VHPLGIEPLQIRMDDASPTVTDFALSGTLERLEEVDEGRRVAAVCTVTVELTSTRSGAIVWRGTAAGRVPVQQRDMAGVVEGLAAAVRASVDRLLDDMESELRRSAATRAP